MDLSEYVELDRHEELGAAAGDVAPPPPEDEEQLPLDAQMRNLVTRLEDAAADFHSLRKRVNELAAAREQTQNELDECRRTLEAVNEARAAELLTIAQLQTELGERRALAARLRSTMAELADAFVEL